MTSLADQIVERMAADEAHAKVVLYEALTTAVFKDIEPPPVKLTKDELRVLINILDQRKFVLEKMRREDP